MRDYIFTSARLGFRNWLPTDLPVMSEINADSAVMDFFPTLLSPEQSQAFIARMQALFQERGYCYFAVDKLFSGDLIGFIGLGEQHFEADFLPCVDIGWRIKKSEWQKGYATEGARACLDFAFNRLALEKVIAIAPAINIPSENVMKKIGMTKVKTFIHPTLKDDERLKCCLLYQKVNPKK